MSPSFTWSAKAPSFKRNGIVIFGQFNAGMGSWFSFTVALARSTFSTTPFPEMRLVVAGEAVAVLAAATELTPGVPISFPGAAFCCCKSSSLDDAASYVRELAETLGDVGSSAAGWIIWLARCQGGRTSERQCKLQCSRKLNCHSGLLDLSCRNIASNSHCGVLAPQHALRRNARYWDTRLIHVTTAVLPLLQGGFVVSNR